MTFSVAALGRQNRQAEAVAAYTQALALDPGRIDTRIARAALYVALGQNESALSDYNIAIDALREQNHIGAIGKARRTAQARGNVNYALEHWEAAAADYREFLIAYPGTTDVELIERMADAHTKSQQWQQAVDALTRALALKPDDRTYLQSRRDRYQHNLHEYELAIADASRQIELNPNDAWPWIARGDVSGFARLGLRCVKPGKRIGPCGRRQQPFESLRALCFNLGIAG